MPEAKNDYNANIQRVFFIDEAHRSYSRSGEFFKNLMTCDLDAVYIALTGTPLLTKKERSSLKFGDYSSPTFATSLQIFAFLNFYDLYNFSFSNLYV